MKRDPMMEALHRKRMSAPSIEIIIGGEEDPEKKQFEEKMTDLAPVPEHMEKGDEEADMDNIATDEMIGGDEAAMEGEVNQAMTEGLNDSDKENLMKSEPKTLLGKARKMALERMKK